METGQTEMDRVVAERMIWEFVESTTVRMESVCLNCSEFSYWRDGKIWKVNVVQVFAEV